MIDPRINFEKKTQTRSEDEAKLKNDFAKVCATDEGRAVLRAVMHLTGYQLPSTCCDPTTNEIQPFNTVYNAARQNIWHSIRPAIPHEHLIQIELPYPKPVREENDNGDE